MTATSLTQDLESFLSDLSPACSERVSWRGGQIELENHVFLTDRPSPPALTSSGRCIVVSRGRVLLMSNPTDTHILPGGRIEPGETISEATRREVLEETGLRLEQLQQVGILVYQHLTPKPPVYRYPYPVFLNTIFVAEATNPEALLVNDTYELAGEFVAHAEAEPRIAEYQRVLLREAVSRAARTAT
jgi:8-oxo-dGTP pyrophosphatase MutT (NUDIX family)